MDSFMFPPPGPEQEPATMMPFYLKIKIPVTSVLITGRSSQPASLVTVQRPCPALGGGGGGGGSSLL